MAFNRGRCSIPTVYCGDAERIPDAPADTRYTRKGTRQECLSKGIGAGQAIERTKNLPKSSLQTIKYIGPIYDSKFHDMNIDTRKDLIRYARNHTKNELYKLLKGALSKSNGTIDRRAFNSVLMMLDDAGVEDMMQCLLIKS
jgi:hypothetical protein